MLISTLFSYFSLHRILRTIIHNNGSYYPKLFRVTRVYIKLIDFDINRLLDISPSRTKQTNVYFLPREMSWQYTFAKSDTKQEVQLAFVAL